MGLFLSRVHHAIFVVLCCLILCSTRAASILSSRPILPSPSRAASVKDGASSAPPKACPSPTRARRQAARDRMVYHAMIRGEPAIGHEQSRANHACIRLNPYKGPDHEAVIRFCGQGSEAAGPFSQRHCSHSRIRIAATSDRHRLPRIKRSQVPNPVCPFSFLQSCSRRRPQLDTVRYLTSRGQAPQRYQQLARQCHDHCRLARAARPLGPRAIPPRQRAVFLEH